MLRDSEKYVVKCHLGTNRTTYSYKEAMEWLEKCGSQWAYIAERPNRTATKYKVIATRCVLPATTQVNVNPAKRSTKLRAAIARARYLLDTTPTQEQS